MKIIIISQDEPVFTQVALRKLTEAKANQIKAVYLLPHYLIFGSFWKMLRYYFACYGIKFVFKIGLKRLFASQQKKFPLPVYRIRKITPKIIGQIREISPDFIVSLSATQVFSEDLLSLPRRGCINLHSGPLPKYRGSFPTFWQFLNDENKIGITVHFMNEKIDAGDILLQDYIEIYPEDSLFSLLDRVKITGIQILLKALNMLESNNIITIPNDIEKGSYYRLPERKDVKLLLSKNKRIY